MTYFDDLSAYAYFPSEPHAIAKNIGWLDAAHEFPREQPSPAFLDALWAYSRVIVNPTRGLHDCPFCTTRCHTFVRNGERLLLGSGEIRAFAPDGTIFAAPNLTYHFVAEHHYRPPLEFVRAVSSGPLPSTDDYARLLRSSGVEWRDNPPRDEEPRAYRFVKTERGIERVEVDRHE